MHARATSSTASSGPDEAGTEEEVLRRIAGDGQLRDDDEVGGRPRRLRDRGRDPLYVPVEVADDDVQLGESDPHGVILAVGDRRRVSVGFCLSVTNVTLPTVETESVTIARRFRGPLDSANGGYAAGLLGSRLGTAAEVTLHLPPPLERPLTIRRDGVRLLLEDDGHAIAEAVPGDPDLAPPAPPSPAEAAAAEQGVGAWGPPQFAECFVCGVRGDGSGLGIHAGAVDGREGSSPRRGSRATSRRRWCGRRSTARARTRPAIRAAARSSSGA